MTRTVVQVKIRQFNTSTTSASSELAMAMREQHTRLIFPNVSLNSSLSFFSELVQFQLLDLSFTSRWVDLCNSWVPALKSDGSHESSVAPLQRAEKFILFPAIFPGFGDKIWDFEFRKIFWLRRFYPFPPISETLILPLYKVSSCSCFKKRFFSLGFWGKKIV